MRFASFVDEESERFEEELCARARDAAPDADGKPTQEPLLLPIPQRHLWLRHTRREFRLLQVRDRAGHAAAQLVAYVYRPQRFSAIGRAVGQKLGPAVNGCEEGFALATLRALLAEQGDILTLRLQPRRREIRELRDFEARARRVGYALCDPDSVTRTLLFDLVRPMEQILADLPKRTRAKVRHRKREQIELRILSEDKWIPHLRAAADASVSRTDPNARSHYDWDAIVSVARQRPDLVRIVGLFLSHRPDELLAFVSAERHGPVAEYTAAGSFGDPELRSLPFNYFLVWDLITWAKEHGSHALDLGGITDGGDDDPLATISEFKRHFTDNEVEIGRELLTALHPIRAGAYDAVQALRERWLPQAQSTQETEQSRAK